MKKQVLRLPFMVFFAAAMLLSTLTTFGQEQYNSGELIVQMQFQKDVNEMMQDVNTQSPNLKLEMVQTLSRRLNIFLLQYDANAVTDMEALVAVNYHKNVAVAQFNHTNIVSRGDTCTNDTQFPNQWSHATGNGTAGPGADMASCDAWSITTGGTSTMGDRIVVAVIDGGYDLNHQDLNFWVNAAEIPGDNLDNDNNGYVDDINGWDAVANDGNVMFSGGFDSHATHVSGIIGAVGNNNTGVVGVNHDVEIMGITGSSGNEATVVAAYSYVVEQRAIYNSSNGAQGAFVVSTNSSFGVDNADPANYPIWCAMYDTMGSYGIISAGATSNSNTNVDMDGDVPTACGSQYLITVTNTNSQDQRNGSGYGAATIDMGAPGTDILSTLPNDAYGNQTGTSMATPQVAGAVALMWSAACPGMMADFHADPAALALVMRNYLLNDGLDPAPDLVGETVTGGRLNLRKCVVATGNYTGCPPLGISEVANENIHFTAFPNPNEGQFNVGIQSNAYGVFNIEVTDVLGKTVQNQQIKLNGIAEEQIEFDLGNVEPGMYFVRLHDNGSISQTVKIFVK